MGFDQGTIRDIMRLSVAILHTGNMTFSETNQGESCVLVEDGASIAVASLLGVSHENLTASLTSRVLILKDGKVCVSGKAGMSGKAGKSGKASKFACCRVGLHQLQPAYYEYGND
jgi:hypothetical protein